MIAYLSLMGDACRNFAIGIRLMSGYDLVTEGFKEGQVGSSAMPHKMNTRSSERIYGFANLLKMYDDGASRISGDVWEEGDVSDSVVRRVIIPDAFYVSDGLCETTLTVLNEMGVYPAIIEKEVDRYLPFMAASQILMLAVKKGMGREEAHKIIKGYAVQEALRMRAGEDYGLAEVLSEDNEFEKHGISYDNIQDILNDRMAFIGNAQNQIKNTSKKCGDFLLSYQTEASYKPGDIL